MARDLAEFSDFAAARWGSLFRTAYLLTGDHGLAEDLLQTTLVKCYVAWPRLREHAAADAYVRKALTNTFLSWRRKKSWGREEPTDDPPEPGVGDTTTDIAVRHLMIDALSRLPARQRAVIVLRFYDDLGVDQVAAAMGCSTGTVKSQTSDGLAKLRDILGADLDIETTRTRARGGGAT
jgi:RNA polymerase sigma-70 factor (sigma-E family)